MLVLTRRIDESLNIGGSITITVLSIDGDKVKIGINAPREITILRQEIYQAVQEQTKLEQWLAEKPEPETFKNLRELLVSNSSDGFDETAIPSDQADVEKPVQQ
jgi:carbon storage regulator